MDNERADSVGLRSLAWLTLCLSPAAVFILGISFAFDPIEVAKGEHLTWLNVSLQQCPGCGLCGLSRAFSLASHGFFVEALRLNWLVGAFYPIAWITVISSPLFFWRSA